jgi:aromatic ring-opening dioxygenase catalytic subunit (LigB family)
VLKALLARDIDAAYSWNMKLDHSFFGPLHFVTPRMQVPVLPIFQNTLLNRMLTPARAYGFGVALGRAIASVEDDRRVVVIGSGGLSHWVGGPEHGRVSEEFDRTFLDHFAGNSPTDRAWLCDLEEDVINAEAGNGGQEVRNWLAVRGVLPEGRADVYYYEPLVPFIVGCGVAQVRPDEIMGPIS